MKSLLSLTALSALAASPALAHGEGHIHPHGFEVAFLGAAVLVVLAVVVMKSR